MPYSGYPDRELVDLIGQGDKKAFSELFLRYNRLLFIHAHKLLGNKEEARDIVQDIFASIWDNRTALSFNSNFAGYLYTRVRNKIFDLISRQKVQEKYLDSIKTFWERGEATTDHLLRSRQLQELIEKEIALLPEKMREVFQLSRKENLTRKQIAQQLGLSEKTVKNQINSALKTLRGKLGLLAYLYLLLR